MATRDPLAETAATERRPPSWPPRARELSGVTLGDRYVIQGLIGEGHFAATYDARDVTLCREVAVKTLQVGEEPD